MNKRNTHAKRMRQLICDTMISLLEEKEFSKITVQDILNRAEIQRATFYRYYKDKYEVVEVINSYLSNHFADIYINGHYLGGTVNLEELEHFWHKYAKIIPKLLFFKKEYIHFLEDTQNVFVAKYMQAFPESSEYEAFLAAHNSIASIIWCTQNTSSYTEISEVFHSSAQLHWMANFYNIPVPKFTEFIENHQKKQ